MAGFARVFAGLVAGDVFQHAQRRVRFAQALQGIQCQAPARRLGAEEEQAVELLAGHGLELREQGAEGLADAGGGLRQQVVAVARGAVYGLGQLPLAMAKFAVGESQRFQCLIARLLVRLFLPRPVRCNGGSAGRRSSPSCGGAMAFAEHRPLLGDDVEVHHRQIQFLEAQFLSHSSQP